MRINKTAVIASFAIILGTTSFNASARSNIDVGIVIGNAPPPVRYEVMPAPRVGKVWIPGFWDWNGKRHTWVNGHWERVRTGYVYESPNWHETDRSWHLARGEWKRERDDHHHYQHHRRGHKRDRDHDGIPNRYDDHPNNPRRH